jgi:hypothetical protein
MSRTELATGEFVALLASLWGAGGRSGWRVCPWNAHFHRCVDVSNVREQLLPLTNWFRIWQNNVSFCLLQNLHQQICVYCIYFSFPLMCSLFSISIM